MLKLCLCCNPAHAALLLLAEPPEVVEATVIAALNLNYPGSRLAVHILDDGNNPALKDLVTRLQFQAQ